jgi:hypothetical protein
VTLADFDGVLYHVSNPDADRTKVQISISARFFHELKEIGVEQVRRACGVSSTFPLLAPVSLNLFGLLRPQSQSTVLEEHLR